jgi:poly(A) polymerase/tRNA nucleotidyltransferase (CCA-adding enzyme)
MFARTPPPERASRPALSAPREVLHLAERLRAAGGQAWVVGGAVRDLLLGREVHDWDLATDLPPERTKSLFPRTMEVGARFGTITVLIREASYEITTFRRDGLYSDARRPDDVRYAEHLEDDLVRRDFTVNALAWDPIENRLADPTGGLDDLDARLLRAVGDPVERFTEDGLRLLRAVRFAAQLDFEIEAETYRALVLCAPRLERIAAERVRDELEKLLLAPRPSSALLLLQETGLLRRILPELSACYGVPQNRHHAYDVFHHTLAAVDAAPPDNRIVRLAALFHDTGKPESREERADGATFYAHQSAGRRHVERALRRLRVSGEDRRRVSHLVQHHMFHYRPEWTDAAVRRFLREVGAEHLDDLFALRAADTRGNGLKKRLAPELAELRSRIEEEIARQSALTVRDLATDGRDLMAALGLPPGPEIGRLLRTLLEEVIEEPERNERERLLARARELHAARPGDAEGTHGTASPSEDPDA